LSQALTGHTWNTRLAAIGLYILLFHFGVNVTALAAALGLGGLVISLAAKDTIADAIAGLIILLDQPFRVGDRIEVEKVGTWGDRFARAKANTAEKLGDLLHTSPVGQYGPAGDSPYGCADMSCNVLEWCSTKWVGDYEGYDKGVEAREKLEGEERRVERGGSFAELSEHTRCAWRFGALPDHPWGAGFRVVLSSGSLLL